MKSLPIRTNPTPSEAKAKYVQRENELPDHSCMKFKKQLTVTNWDEFQRLAQEARADGVPLQTADGLLNPEVFDGWQFEFDLVDKEDLA